MGKDEKNDPAKRKAEERNPTKRKAEERNPEKRKTEERNPARGKAEERNPARRKAEACNTAQEETNTKERGQCARTAESDKAVEDLQRNLRTENDRRILGGIRVIRREDPEYPPAFLHYPRMPQSIYVLGDLPDPTRKTVAIVGARGCSSYGKEQARLYGRAMAEAGIQVISGMAYGVDAWGQTGALEGGGRVFSVLGTGVDICYPRQNYALYRRILREGGGMISEYGPGAKPDAWHFPVRNRLISALADIVLVVEAKVKSGSLITADYAMEQGKSIYAVPGRNGDPLSAGCNRLIAQGAGIACSPDVLLEELGVNCGDHASELSEEGECGAGNQLPKKWAHADDFQKLFCHLESSPKSLHVLISESGLDPSTTASVLMQLCVSGYVEESAPGYFRRK